MIDGVKVIEYDVTGSTNADAKNYARSATDFESVLFVAREQTAGRGRLGRHHAPRLALLLLCHLRHRRRQHYSEAESVAG